MNQSLLQEARLAYQPELPTLLDGDIAGITVKKIGGPTTSVADSESIKKLLGGIYGQHEVEIVKGRNPDAGRVRNVGVLLSGGPAPGGHNVICGLYDALKKANKANRLFGFRGGATGIANDNCIEITGEMLKGYRNTGGFDLLTSGRKKLETEEDFSNSAKAALKHGLCAIVFIGGDDTITNAATLDNWFVEHKVPVQVIGCPKTIDGDLKNAQIETTFGFDTATKTYSEMIGNICRDARSSAKYWHFVRLMGRSASHVTLECGLETHPNITLVGEEIEAKKQTLSQIVAYIADTVEARAARGENFGVVLIPEGVIEFIPEIRTLIDEINSAMARKAGEFNKLTSDSEKIAFILANVSEGSGKVFSSLPLFVQQGLYRERDPHGNVQLSQIETEKLFAEMVSAEMASRKAQGKYTAKFGTQCHFFGYEGRCGFPSPFDSNYCYALGYTAFILIANGCNGYVALTRNLTKDPLEWSAGGEPISAMCCMEERNGKQKPVISKALVTLDGKPFTYFAKHREEWRMGSQYVYPGPIQFWGPREIVNRTTVTLALESGIED